MDDATLYASIPAPTEGTMLRREAFGAMLAGGNLSILNLNPDAVAIWELIDGQRTVADIHQALTATYDEQDVQEALPEFMRYCFTAGCITLHTP